MDAFRKFYQTLQDQQTSINLKCEVEQESINFLDTTAYKGPRFAREGTLDTKVYFKPTDVLQLL